MDTPSNPQSDPAQVSATQINVSQCSTAEKPAVVETCAHCGEPLVEILSAQPEYCFNCAVHVCCSCSD